MGGYHSHPATPQSTVPSPGAASINSIHEEYSDMNSPGWPRTPASPVRILISTSKSLHILVRLHAHDTQICARIVAVSNDIYSDVLK